MSELSRRVDAMARRTGFAGVVRLERAGAVALDEAYGLADRSHGIAIAVDHQGGPVDDRVDLGQQVPVTVEVPVRFQNEAASPGSNNINECTTHDTP